jgi:DNA-directed RNA polymerase specialized sigma24 family protein
MTEEEFTNLIEAIRPELVAIARRRCGRDQAEDAVQKTVMRVWAAGRWQIVDPTTVTARLRALVSLNGQDEFRQIVRFRDAQRNLGVLTHNGCKHTQSAPNSDGEETNK